jgi:hypothetical protein
MRQILFHDPEGRILRVVASETAPPEQYGPAQDGDWAHLILDATTLIDAHAIRVVGQSLQLRPELPGLAISESAPAMIDLSVLPEGTVVRVANAPGDILEITDLTEPLTLTEPGPYALRLNPPFPWAARSLTVELGTEQVPTEESGAGEPDPEEDSHA